MSRVMAGCPGYRGSLLCSLDGVSGCPGRRPDVWVGGRISGAEGRMSGLVELTLLLSG